MECTHALCEDKATKIMAMPPRVVNCVYVASYCDDHAEGILYEGGFFATGPALSDEAIPISGRRD